MDASKETSTKLRELFVSNLKNSWPFFSEEYPKNIAPLLKPILSSVENVKLRIGKPLFHHGPVVVNKHHKKTFQGQIYFLEYKDLKTVAKISKINTQKSKNWFDTPRLSLSDTWYLSPPFLESWVYATFAPLCEKDKMIHIPLCYYTGLANFNHRKFEDAYEVIKADAHKKLNIQWTDGKSKKRKGKEEVVDVGDEKRMKMNEMLMTAMHENKRNPSFNQLSQIVILENLQSDLPSVLFKETNYHIWMSVLFQVTVALYYFQKKFGLIHNDLYCDNVRIRMIDPDTTLFYYFREFDVYLKVPTFGNVAVIIDFGRVYLSFDKDKYVSNDFQKDDPKFTKKPHNNPSIDLIRFVLSLELNDTLDVIANEKAKIKMKQWIEAIVKTDDPKVNILKELKSKENKKNPMANGYWLDEYPRFHCFNGKAKDNIAFFFDEFRCEKPPSGTKLYVY